MIEEPTSKDTPITVRLPPEMLAQLRASAKELDRSLSWVIRQALERWLKASGGGGRER